HGGAWRRTCSHPEPEYRDARAQWHTHHIGARQRWSMAVCSRFMDEGMVRVSYLELTQTPAPIQAGVCDKRISREKLPVDEYLELYRRIGQQLRWDQRLRMPRSELIRLLDSERSRSESLDTMTAQS